MQSFASLSAANASELADAQHDLTHVRTLLEQLPEPTFHEDMKDVPLSGLGHTEGYGDHNQPKPRWTCHALTRLVKPQLKLPWEIWDGVFADFRNHSWLEIHTKASYFILDVYPIGGLSGPLLLDAESREWRRLYACPRYTEANFATFEQEAAIARALLNLAPTKEKPA